MRIPWVVSLIIGGIIVGPFGLDWFQSNSTIDFLGTIGLVMLMFIAGLESKFSEVKKYKKEIFVIGASIGFVPALVGFGLISAFGYELAPAVLIGIIFMSSAIAMLVPIFQYHKIIHSDLVKIIIASTVIIDALSLIFLSVFLQLATGDGFSITSLFVYPLILASLGVFAWVIPKLKWIATQKFSTENDIFENELQLMVLILIGLVMFFELVGLHAIIAGFFAGMILSRSMENPLLKAKLHAISYGFFIPVFFVLLGSQTDITVFVNDPKSILIMSAIIVSLVISKFISGYLAGVYLGYKKHSAAFIGATALPQLSTALAVAFLGFGEGILDQTLLSSVVGLTVVTSIVSPVIINEMSSHVSRFNFRNK